MVSLARGDDGVLATYPNAKGSGAVTAFSQADGFIAIGPQVESVAAGRRNRKRGAAVRVGFIPAQDERYDFIIPKKRLERMPVRRFRAVLTDCSVLAELGALGFAIDGAL